MITIKDNYKGQKPITCQENECSKI